MADWMTGPIMDYQVGIDLLSGAEEARNNPADKQGPAAMVRRQAEVESALQTEKTSSVNTGPAVAPKPQIYGGGPKGSIYPF